MRHQFPLLIAMMVCLRLVTGWHFFHEGQKKFDGSFTSKYFLMAAKGPVAPFANALVNENSGRDALLLSPCENGNATDGNSYNVWLETVEQEWLNKAAKVGGERITEIAKQKLQDLRAYLEDQVETIEDIQHESWRAEQLRKKNQIPEDSELAPFVQKRLNDKDNEIKQLAAPIYATADRIEQEFSDAVVAQLEKDETGRAKLSEARRILQPISQIARIDTIVKWTVLLCGVGLFLGFFTRLSAIAASGFLLSVMATQPIWVEGADTTYFFYQLVEVIVLLTLAYVGAGRWAGLDALAPKLWTPSIWKRKELSTTTNNEN